MKYRKSFFLILIWVFLSFLSYADEERQVITVKIPTFNPNGISQGDAVEYTDYLVHRIQLLTEQSFEWSDVKILKITDKSAISNCIEGYLELAEGECWICGDIQFDDKLYTITLHVYIRDESEPSETLEFRYENTKSLYTHCDEVAHTLLDLILPKWNKLDREHKTKIARDFNLVLGVWPQFNYFGGSSKILEGTYFGYSLGLDFYPGVTDLNSLFIGFGLEVGASHRIPRDPEIYFISSEFHINIGFVALGISNIMEYVGHGQYDPFLGLKARIHLPPIDGFGLDILSVSIHRNMAYGGNGGTVGSIGILVLSIGLSDRMW
jgi:hypothetical protein